jgi:Na+/melibiose symporter-like transporter
MAMFLKASVIAFTVFICGAMLTIAHYDAHFAQLPKSVLAKRAA